MKTLYLVSANLTLLPERAAQLAALLNPGDSVLYTGIGLYCSGRVPLSPGVRLYGLHTDAAATGYHPPDEVELTDYAGMVRLCENHERCINW